MQMASNLDNEFSSDEYQALQLALQDSLGVVVGEDGRDLITGKLQPLMVRERLNRLSDLAKALRQESPESIRSDVLEAITTHNTQWFGYPEINRLLNNYILPSLIEKQQTDCRFWLVGCGQGQSAYSLAMLLDDARQQLGSEINIEIVATDTSGKLIEKAQNGVYDNAELEGLPQSRHRRYLTAVDESQQQWRVSESLRDMLQFRVVDLLQDAAAMGHFDVIIAPDVLMYFSVPLRSQLLCDFAVSLDSAGILVVNHNEPVIPFCDRFDMVDHEAGRFYRQVK